MSFVADLLRRSALLLIPGLFACFRNQAAGMRGFMPLDQGIVFDGAWRLLQGQLPGRDFDTPGGLGPMTIQALIFRFGEVDWGHYVGHASALNALVAMAVTWSARNRGLGALAAILLGLASGELLYPATGTPFFDQHTLAFAGLALLTLWPKAGRPSSVVLAFAALLVFLALASKSGPMGLLSLAGFFVALLRRRDRSSLALGLAFFLIPLATAWTLGLDMGALYRSHVVEPGPLVRLRLEALFLGEIRVPQAMRGSLALAGLTFVFALLRSAYERHRERFVNSVRGGLVLGAGLLFIALTNNQPETLLGFFPCALLFLWPAAFDGWRPKLRRAALGLLLALLVVEGIQFDRQEVQTRRGLDMEFSDEEVSAALETPRIFAGLHWATNDHWRQRPEGWGELIAYLREAEGPFWLLGDSSPLYAACGRVSPAPLLWFHPGLTLPRFEDAEREGYERRLLAQLESRGVRRIVIENERTWMGEGYRRFPILADAWKDRAQAPISIGGFVVIELRRP